jgi:hypothetical protein
MAKLLNLGTTCTLHAQISKIGETARAIYCIEGYVGPRNSLGASKNIDRPCRKLF